jgi:YfiH family protein
MTAHLGVPPDALLSLHQIHSAEALAAAGPWPGGERPKADGLATATPDLALAVASADCGPVLFADPHAPVIGACHAGWKGAFTGILEATIDRMLALGATRTAIVAVLGPTIGPDAYEVGPEFTERFASADPDNLRYFRPSGRADHSLFDLPSYIVERLERTGVGEVGRLGLCTYSDEERFFSYRRSVHRGEPDYGRLISAISLTQ